MKPQRTMNGDLGFEMRAPRATVSSAPLADTTIETIERLTAGARNLMVNGSRAPRYIRGIESPLPSDRQILSERTPAQAFLIAIYLVGCKASDLRE